MTTSTPSSSSSSNKTSARSFMARTGFLVSVMCAAAAFGGGLATLVLVNTSNSRPYDRGDHPHTEAAALQHRLAVVETQLAEVTATVTMLTTTIGTDTDTVSSSSSSIRRRLVTGDFTLSKETSALTGTDTADDTADGTSNEDYYYSFDGNGDDYYSDGGNDSDDSEDYDYGPSPPPDPVCTEDAKVCSDGVTFLTRDPNNNCKWPECPTPNREERLSRERFKAFLEKQSDGHVTSLENEDEMEATPPPDNDLVCTPFRVWLLGMIFRYDAEENQLYPVDSNRTIYVDNAVGATEKKTMYKPTAKDSRLCNGDKIVCPTPTEELGIFAGNFVYPAAGPIIGDDKYSSWRNYMVLLDPVMIETDNGPLQQYQSSFAITEYDYESGEDAYSPGKNRVNEHPITGGTGRFGSASGSEKTKGYTFIKNEATGYYEDFLEVQFNVCVPPPKNTNPAPPGPPKKSGKTHKASF